MRERARLLDDGLARLVGVLGRRVRAAAGAGADSGLGGVELADAAADASGPRVGRRVPDLRPVAGRSGRVVGEIGRGDGFDVVVDESGRASTRRRGPRPARPGA